MPRVRRPRAFFATLVLQLVIAVQFANATAGPGLNPEDAKQIMPLSQIKRGMRGYGLTVFQGTKIDKFDFEILGVLPKMNTGKDLIMVRIGGGPITSRQSGLIAGMSGSPCYIEGRLVGAVSYGGSFNKEPIGMLTPIADMLEAWDANLPKSPSGYSSPQSLPNPVDIGGRQVKRVAIDRPQDLNVPVDDGVLRLRPLMTPLMVSGLSARGMGRLAEVLRPFGIEPIAGPGSASMPKSKVSLVPGAAVGISLARGDIDATAVGTLTYRRGNRILALGHPMLGVGAIDAPMTTAYVADIISRYSISTKLAAPLDTVGRIFQDRPWSVAGAVHSASKTIPALIRVNDEAHRRFRIFKVEVINHPLLASGILTAVVSEAIYQTHPSPGDATAEVTYEVNADQIGTIRRKNVFFDPTSIDERATSDLGALLMLLSTNRFHPLDIKSVNVNVRIQQKRDTASVERIFVKKNDFEPGETVEVGVVLRPYKKDRVTRTFTVKIPATAADGRLTLQVRGGAGPGLITAPAASSEEEGTTSVGAVASPDMAHADNVKQLVAKYLEREKNNELVVRLIMRSNAVNVSGEKLTGLPNAIAEIMKSSRNSGVRLERDEAKQVYDAGTIVYGAAQVSINVKRKDVKEKKADAKAAVAEPEIGGGAEPDTSPDEESDELMYDVSALQAAVEAPSDKNAEEDMSESAAAAEEPETDEAAEAELKPEVRTPSESDDVKREAKTVVRQPKTWAQRTQADFAKGEFSGVSASSENKLELVPTVGKVVETPEQFVWSLAPAKGGVYAGTGSSGRIYHVSDSGEIKVFFETGELEVHSLAKDKAGNLYAGTSPNGRVFKIAPDGTGKEIWKAKERYVLALAIDSEDNLYAGVGDAGKVYKIAPDARASVFAEVSDQQILSLFWAPQGFLLIGTGINGILYKADKTGRAVPIFDADEGEITSVRTDSNGNIYAGTSSRGAVYKILPDGTSKTVLSKVSRVLALACDPQDNIYAVSDGSIVKITPREVTVPLDSAREKAQFLTLVYSEDTESLYIGAGNVGSVYVSKCCNRSGTFESAVHDAGMISKWGKVKWTAEVPENTSVEIRTRTGNVPTPDATWSAWSPPYSISSGDQIASEDARYIQYQVTLTREKPNVSAKVSSISVSYLTPNQPPKVKITAPRGGEVWAGKKTITWTASDPDKDLLTYDIYYSSDGGKEWKALAGGVRGSAGKTAEEIKSKIKSELEKSKDVPEEMKREFLKEEPKPAGAASKKPEPSAAPKKTSHDLDTSSLPDGTYLIKITASDKSSNASGALTDEAVSEPFVICNKPPKLTLDKRRVQTNASGPAVIVGSVSGTVADITGVQYRVDDGGWAAAAADDGVFDSPNERFTVTTDSLESGKHKVEVQAIDAAGNASSDTVEVSVK